MNMECSNSKFPTLMGSVGGWVFVVDVTKGGKGWGETERERESLVEFTETLHGFIFFCRLWRGFG